MRFTTKFVFLLGIVALGLASLVVWPQADLAVSGSFYTPTEGFLWRKAWLFKALVWLAYYGSRVLGVFLLVGGIIAALRRRPFLKLSSKSWLFLFLGLLIGPGLVANLVFKDNWGRARPRDVVEFGGHAQFSPAFYMSQECKTNCSFVSGDASFGFYLTSFAYVVPLRRSRRVFWGGVAFGSLFAAARVIIGAHFLSDILFAMLFIFIVNSFLHGMIFDWEKTRNCWKSWLAAAAPRQNVK